DVHFKGLRLHTIAGEATLEGKVDNFVNYLLGNTNGFTAALIAHSDSLNLNPVLMKTGTSGTQRAETFQADTAGMILASVRDSLKIGTMQAQKELLSRFEFDVQLNAKKMVMRRVNAEDARIKLRYADETLDVRSLRLYTCGGKFTASGVIEKF